MDQVAEDTEAPHGRGKDGLPLAPYGFKEDGTPKKLPGRPSTRPSRRRSSTAKKPAAKANGAPDYTEGIKGMASIPLAILAAFGAKNPVYAVDAYVIGAQVPAMAEAVNELAQHQPMVAAALDKVLQVGPYGALLSVLIPAGLQVACNHGLIPAGFMGTRPAQDVMAEMMAEHAAREAAAGAAYVPAAA